MVPVVPGSTSVTVAVSRASRLTPDGMPAVVPVAATVAETVWVSVTSTSLNDSDDDTAIVASSPNVVVGADVLITGASLVPVMVMVIGRLTDCPSRSKISSV